MQSRSALDEANWIIQRSGLEELIGCYPEVWKDVDRELVSVAKCGEVQRLAESAIKAKSEAETWKKRIEKSRSNPKVIKSALPRLVKSRMLTLLIEKASLATASGQVSGKVRFNLLNGFIIQKLLFRKALTRKPVSLCTFRFWWRFVTQKKLLIPLLKRRGIYCFYSKELIQRLAELINGRSCLEIGAGDGTLAQFLNDAGAEVIATDDYSWSHEIQYPDQVMKQGAKAALTEYKPQVVICSWPPVANAFESHVFATKSVELYIVIGSRFRFISGNWNAYEEQNQFNWGMDERLSTYVIPPEAANAVLLLSAKTRHIDIAHKSSRPAYQW